MQGRHDNEHLPQVTGGGARVLLLLPSAGSLSCHTTVKTSLQATTKQKLTFVSWNCKHYSNSFNNFSIFLQIAEFQYRHKQMKNVPRLHFLSSHYNLNLDFILHRCTTGPASLSGLLWQHRLSAVTEGASSEGDLVGPALHRCQEGQQAHDVLN